MKHIALMLLLYLPLAAYADAVDEWQKVCESVSTFAETLMKARQNGVPMAEMMRIAESSPAAAKSAKTMTVAAYERNRWNTEENKRREIENFRDENYLACIQAKKK